MQEPVVAVVPSQIFRSVQQLDSSVFNGASPLGNNASFTLVSGTSGGNSKTNIVVSEAVNPTGTDNLAILGDKLVAITGTTILGDYDIGNISGSSYYVGTATVIGSDGIAYNGIVEYSNSSSGCFWFFSEATQAVISTGQTGVFHLADGLGANTWTLSGTTSVTAAPATPTISGVVDDVAPGLGAVANGGFTNDATPTLSGTGSTGALIRLYTASGTVLLGTTTVGGNGTWSFTIAALTNGTTYDLTVTSVTSSGGTASAASGTYTLTVDTSIATPTIALSSDTGSGSDNITSGKALSGSADAGSTVVVMEGTATIGTTTADASGHWSLANTSAADGSHTYTVTATDTAGNTATSGTLAVTYDTSTPATPTIALTSDTGLGSDNITSSKTLSGTAEAGSTVAVMEGTVTIGTTTADASGHWSLANTGATDGSHTYSVTSTDTAGNATSSGTLAVTYDTTADAGSDASIHVNDTANHVISNAETTAVEITVAGVDSNTTATAVFTDGTHSFSVEVQNGLNTVDLGGHGLDTSGSLTYSMHLADTAGNTADISGTSVAYVICFYPGTGIATPSGRRAVESLAIGDLVLTSTGEARPVRWMGRQTVSTRFADPLRVLPIRITAGTLGEGLPQRDLLVSPDHALLLEGVLVQAGALVNGSSIRREAAVPQVFTYHHVELADHSLVLAEGVPAETFVDNVERLGFDNWAEHQALYGHLPTILEMPLPRAKSARQVPAALRAMLARRLAA